MVEMVFQGVQGAVVAVKMAHLRLVQAIEKQILEQKQHLALKEIPAEMATLILQTDLVAVAVEPAVQVKMAVHPELVVMVV